MRKDIYEKFIKGKELELTISTLLIVAAGIGIAYNKGYSNGAHDIGKIFKEQI